jgi:hypothetical protein
VEGVATRISVRKRIYFFLRRAAEVGVGNMFRRGSLENGKCRSSQLRVYDRTSRTAATGPEHNKTNEATGRALSPLEELVLSVQEGLKWVSSLVKKV